MQLWWGVLAVWGMMAAGEAGETGGSGGELGTSDSWLLMVEAGRDGPARRITPKSVFIVPALASRAERCEPGHRYDHVGRCVKVVNVDATSQRDLLLKRLQGIQSLRHGAPRVPPAPASSGPLHFSLPLGAGNVPVSSTPLVPMTTSTQASLTSIASPSLEDKENRRETQSSTVTVTEIAKELGVFTNSSTEEENSETNFSTTVTLPMEESEQPTTVLIEGSGDGSTTYSSLEGSGNYLEGSGVSGNYLEGSGSTTDDVPTPTAIPAEDRPPRSTTLTSEEMGVTEPSQLDLTSPKPTNCCEESTPIPPSEVTVSLLLAVLNGEVLLENSKNISANSTETINVALDKGNQTEVISTTTETSIDDEGTEQLPLLEFIDLVLPKVEPLMDNNEKILIPLGNIKWNFADNLPESLTKESGNFTEERTSNNVTFLPAQLIENSKLENVVIERLVSSTERTKVEESESDTERTFQENVKDDINSSGAWWVNAVPHSPSWVRFPDDFPPEPTNLSQGSRNREPDDQEQKGSRFRFPEEVIDPEHRPILLKFWSKIPMIQEDESTGKEYQNDETHWIAP